MHLIQDRGSWLAVVNINEPWISTKCSKFLDKLTCLQTYIRTPFPASPNKRAVMTYGVAHALTFQERLCSMELFLIYNT